MRPTNGEISRALASARGLVTFDALAVDEPREAVLAEILEEVGEGSPDLAHGTSAVVPVVGVDEGSQVLEDGSPCFRTGGLSCIHAGRPRAQHALRKLVLVLGFGPRLCRF